MHIYEVCMELANSLHSLEVVARKVWYKEVEYGQVVVVLNNETGRSAMLERFGIKNERKGSIFPMTAIITYLNDSQDKFINNHIITEIDYYSAQPNVDEALKECKIQQQGRKESNTMHEIMMGKDNSILVDLAEIVMVGPVNKVELLGCEMFAIRCRNSNEIKIEFSESGTAKPARAELIEKLKTR